MTTLPQLKRRLKDLLPVQDTEITKARSAIKLLEIATDALEFHSNTLFRTGFELGKKVHVDHKRKENAPKARATRNTAINRELISHFKTAVEGFKKHQNVIRDPNPEKQAAQMAWRSTQDRFQRLTGKPIKMESLKKRLRKDFRK